jgi:hypothetical protein
MLLIVARFLLVGGIGDMMFYSNGIVETVSFRLSGCLEGPPSLRGLAMIDSFQLTQD